MIAFVIVAFGFVAWFQWNSVSFPAKLATLIKDADRVVIAVTTRGAVFTLEKDQATKLKEAVSSAVRDRHHYPAMLDDRLVFYKGTNLIIALPLQDRLFSFEERIYSDNTGLLKSLWEKAISTPPF